MSKHLIVLLRRTLPFFSEAQGNVHPEKYQATFSEEHGTIGASGVQWDAY